MQVAAALAAFQALPALPRATDPPPAAAPGGGIRSKYPGYGRGEAGRGFPQQNRSGAPGGQPTGPRPPMRCLFCEEQHPWRDCYKLNMVIAAARAMPSNRGAPQYQQAAHPSAAAAALAAYPEAPEHLEAAAASMAAQDQDWPEDMEYQEYEEGNYQEPEQAQDRSMYEEPASMSRSRTAA